VRRTITLAPEPFPSGFHVELRTEGNAEQGLTDIHLSGADDRKGFIQRKLSRLTNEDLVF